jgi:TRAP-type C4-dicarboxylate transport system substrate-binding protein
VKKYISILIIVLVATSLIIGGCSSSPATITSTTTTTATTIATSTATSTTTAISTSIAKVYEFKFTDQFTSTQITGIFDETLANMISEKTGGRVKFTFYHSESLGKQIDFLNMIKGGIVDVVTCSVSLYPAQFEMEFAAETPGLGITDRQMRLDLAWEMYNKGLLTGLVPYKVLGFIATPPNTLFLKKNVTTVAGLSGLKIRTTSTPVSNYIKNWGATPVTMAGSEQYMNLDRGIIDGTVTAYESFMQMKLNEVAKYAITDSLSMGSMFVLMNKDKWNALPKDLQELVDQAIQDYRPALIAMTKEPDATWTETLKTQGMTVYAFSPEEAAKLKALADPIKQAWIDEKEAKGLPGQKMMDFIDNYVATYKK